MHDVLISGGGPVGLGLAIELGQHGIDVALVEKRLEPQQIPKGQNLTQRTMEHMQKWGVEKAIRDAKTIPKGIGLGGLTAYGSLLSGYHYDWFKRASVDRYYYTENERLPQYATERVMRARVAELPSVTTHYGSTVEMVEQDANSVTLTMSQLDHSLTDKIKGRYLVGCDGSHSLVRRQGGITEAQTDHDRLMVLVVFRSPAFFDLVKGFRDKQFFNVLNPELDGYWMFFGMVEWGQTMFFHAPVPANTNRGNFDFREMIWRAVGQEFALEMDYVGFWDLRISVAENYRADRIFLAGDSAHSHPPYGGYGVNTGFEDARNLGWKLAAALQGWGGEFLLDSYDAERRPVFNSTADDFIERFISDDRAFVRRYDPGKNRQEFEAAWSARAEGGSAAGILTFNPNYAGSPIIETVGNATPSAVGEHTFRALPGFHLSPCKLSDGRNLDTLLGDVFTHINLDGDEPASRQVQQAASNVGVPVKNVTIDCSSSRQTYGCSHILVRPDNYVAWSGDSVGDCAAVLGRSAGLAERRDTV